MPTFFDDLTYNRFLKQYKTDPAPLSFVDGIAAQALEGMKDTEWVGTQEDAGNMPVHTARVTEFSEGFDSCKFCGDWDGTAATQRAFAGAVAYRVKIPDDALVATIAKITTISVHVYSDRWNVDGLRLAVYLSDDPNPPEDWTTIREGDGVGYYQSAILPVPIPPPDREDKNQVFNFTPLTPPNSKAYLYFFLTMEDYTTTRGNWIEGSGAIDGNSIEVTFDRSVTADTVVEPEIMAHTVIDSKTGFSGYPGWFCAYYQTYPSYLVAGGATNLQRALNAVLQDFGGVNMTEDTGTVLPPPSQGTEMAFQNVAGYYGAYTKGMIFTLRSVVREALSVERVGFDVAIPSSATVGFSTKMMMYKVDGIQYSANGYVLSTAVPQNYKSRDFWTGLASSIDFRDPGGGGTPASVYQEGCTLVAEIDVPVTGLTVGNFISLSEGFTVDEGEYTFVVAMLPWEITDIAKFSAALPTTYGIDWRPNMMFMR